MSETYSNPLYGCNMKRNHHSLLPVYLAPRDGTLVTLIGLYERGWTQEVSCRWDRNKDVWDGWEQISGPTHYILPEFNKIDEDN